MPIYTSYLAKLKNDPKLPERIGACFVYVVTTRAKGIDRVIAPDWTFLNEYKASGDWDSYEKAYLEKIRRNPLAQKWIQNRSNEALIANILLVCYEKDPAHCHRRLLAEEISRFKSLNGEQAEYRGDFNG
jgi:hypothetical protein